MIELDPNFDYSRLPRHVAIIMDGNGRWAVKRNQVRMDGHQQGAKVVKNLVTECSDLYALHRAPEYLTLYSFSLENWKRPAEEVGFLMRMYIDYLREERKTMMEKNIRFHQIGRLENLPDAVLDEVRVTLDETKNNTGMNLVLALNYGGRAEIVDAVRAIAQKARDGKLDPRDVDEKMISSNLYTKNMPDPDLLIRTAGEMRLSNFLLWQISYSELYVTQTLWPDFNMPEFMQAMKTFATRNRRFGGLDKTNSL